MFRNDHVRTAIVSSYVPRRCGIATFSNHLAQAMANNVYKEPLSSEGRVRIAALNDRDDIYLYGSEVIAQIGQHRREDYRIAAEALNNSKIDAVILQHEYGLFGGECGEYVFDLLDHLQKPVVATLHTVLADPSPEHMSVMRRLCDRCDAAVVMADRARTILTEIYGVPRNRIRRIHHGVPDLALEDAEEFKNTLGLAGRPTILTFGLLSPNKGIETMLDALARVVPDCPKVAYIVLGVTHPGVKRESGESYRMSLERRAVELGIQKNVIFHNRYVTEDDLCEYLRASDLYVTPYRSKEQITSGTLAYAAAAGKAVVSTPYWYAQELLGGGRGRLVDFGNVDQLAEALSELLTDETQRDALRKAAYAHGRAMIWPRVGADYVELLDTLRDSIAEKARVRAAEDKVRLRRSLPEVRADHLFVMTDDTGLIQHAVFSLPDRAHGYSTDDNARALLVTAMLWSLFQNEQVIPHLKNYLSFLHYAQPAGGGRFRNFMSYDRRWFDQDGSDDCQGRVIWALGHLASHAPDDSTRMMAESLFQQALNSLGTLEYPRSWAFSILGLHYYLRTADQDAHARSRLVELADRLNDVFVRHEAGDWPWFTDVVTYDNGRLPQALIVAGYVLNRPELVERGTRVLQWLLEVQSGEDDDLSIIGNEGWLRCGGPRAKFDQQPLEPAALIGACKAAYRASGDTKWLNEMWRCFEWYLGRNDLRIPLIDFKTGACCDGLTASGPNRNQGAESVVSWLLSLLIMHEMQTGDAPDIG